MKIETKMRNWVAASGIYQHASAAAESLSRVRAAPPSLRCSAARTNLVVVVISAMTVIC
jgi:hypothetical protein